jgi:hypothetical protein
VGMGETGGGRGAAAAGRGLGQAVSCRAFAWAVQSALPFPVLPSPPGPPLGHQEHVVEEAEHLGRRLQQRGHDRELQAARRLAQPADHREQRGRVLQEEEKEGREGGGGGGRAARRHRLVQQDGMAEAEELREAAGRAARVTAPHPPYLLAPPQPFPHQPGGHLVQHDHVGGAHLRRRGEEARRGGRGGLDVER